MTYLSVTRRAFWDQVRGGCLPMAAATAVGVSTTAGLRWFAEAGGVIPSTSQQLAAYRRLSIDERERIFAGMVQGESIRQIAASIGRAPSTVQREIVNNLRSQRYRPKVRPGAGGRPRAATWRYSPHSAQLRADRKARLKGRPAKLAVNDQLREHVQSRLDLKHSPEQIARRLRKTFPEQPEMWVSHETIYQALFVQGRGALKKELVACLRTGRVLRKPRGRRDGRTGSKIPDMVSISQRPAEADDRAVPGHWEGDLIEGKNNQSAIGTLVERSTGFVLLLHLPQRHGAVEVQQAMIETIQTLPQQLRRTLTWDQGVEMANHAQITLATDMKVYFCDPASPWQRGSNENTNGLLRQYFPKGTDLSGYHRDYLTFVAAELNDRPRKRLDWNTPAEALTALLSNPTDPDGVALAS